MPAPRPMVLPDPWIPWEPYNSLAVGAVSSYGSGAGVATNNDATYLPIILPCDVTIYSLSFAATNGTGNYDLGLYNSALERLASTGSTAMSAAGIKTLSIADMRFHGGDLIYAALAMSSTSGTILRAVYGVALMEGYGWGHQASALPLPNPMVPVTTAAYTTNPVFAFGVR